AAVLDLGQGGNGGGVLAGVDLNASFVGLGRPLARASFVARRGRQKLDRRIEVLDYVRNCFRARFVGLAEIRIIFTVIRNVAPHAIRLEVVVRPQKERFALDAV